MSCKICKSSQPCGCKDTPLSMPPNYVTDPTVCPDPTPCSEIFDSQCICYSGDLLECDGQSWTIPTGTNVETVIQTLFNALCEVATTITPGLGYNIQGFGTDIVNPDLGTLTLYATDPSNETYVSPGNLGFIVDRVGCADDVIITFTWSDPDIVDIWVGAPLNPILTLPADHSSISADVHLQFTSPPGTCCGGTGKIGTFTATWVSCGITKIQTYSYDIP